MGNPGNLALPGPDQRWRCGGCGNLTRFDVARSRRTVEFWHVDLAGDAKNRSILVEAIDFRLTGSA